MIMMPDKKKMITAILGPESHKRDEEEGRGDASDQLASELIEALESKDAPGVKSALRAIFEEFDSEPHEEGPHLP